jgi:hypothetical protein
VRQAFRILRREVRDRLLVAVADRVGHHAGQIGGGARDALFQRADAARRVARSREEAGLGLAAGEDGRAAHQTGRGDRAGRSDEAATAVRNRFTFGLATGLLLIHAVPPNDVQDATGFHAGFTRTSLAVASQNSTGA